MPWTLLLGPLTTLIERIFPDKAKQDEAKAQIMTIMMKAQADEMTAKSNVIVAEAKGESWLQRNWRPLTMMTFVIIMIFNFIFAPIMGMLAMPVPTLEIPPHMWTLLTVGIGGYIGGRSIEKAANSKFNNKAYYDSMRGSYGSLSSQDVERMDKAIKDASK